MDRKAAKELLHIQAWLERVGEIVERGKDAYLADDLLQEAGDSGNLWLIVLPLCLTPRPLGPSLHPQLKGEDCGADTSRVRNAPGPSPSPSPIPHPCRRRSQVLDLPTTLPAMTDTTSDLDLAAHQIQSLRLREQGELRPRR